VVIACDEDVVQVVLRFNYEANNAQRNQRIYPFNTSATSCGFGDVFSGD